MPAKTPSPAAAAARPASGGANAPTRVSPYPQSPVASPLGQPGAQPPAQPPASTPVAPTPVLAVAGKYTPNPAWLSKSGQQKAAAALKPKAQPKPATGATVQFRIVDVYTQWSDKCQSFDPMFAQAQTKYTGRITFERVDAEAKNNKDFVRRYKVDAYPTILFFDPAGKAITRIIGAPPSFEEFDMLIGKVFPDVH
jgi:thiol-disulfide isomerase/thioredoxin